MRFGKETKIKALGKEWTLGRTTVAIIEAVRDAIAERIGDPFVNLERFAPKLPPEKAFELFKEADAIAKQLQMFSLDCPIAEQFLETELGCAEYVRLLLQAHHADSTADTAMAILEHLGAEKVRKAAQQTQGRGPAGNATGPEMSEQSEVAPTSPG